MLFDFLRNLAWVGGVQAGTYLTLGKILKMFLYKVPLHILYLFLTVLSIETSPGKGKGLLWIQLFKFRWMWTKLLGSWGQASNQLPDKHLSVVNGKNDKKIAGGINYTRAARISLRIVLWSEIRESVLRTECVLVLSKVVINLNQSRL